MSWKIYLIKHLDTDMKYVGYTEIDLQKRWDQHRADTTRSISKTLQTDSHRMIMELLEEVETRAIARNLKQQYIQSLNSAEPNGWNRQIIKPKAEAVTTPKKWMPVQGDFVTKSQGVEALVCPNCKDTWTHQSTVDVLNNDVCIYFTCESCHFEDGDNNPPPHYKLLIYQHKGQTNFKTVYYIEEAK
jgi:predicted GIY-YIG superfamily endonuclease